MTLVLQMAASSYLGVGSGPGHSPFVEEPPSPLCGCLSLPLSLSSSDGFKLNLSVFVFLCVCVCVCVRVNMVSERPLA